jgi:hypothetical protein
MTHTIATHAAEANERLPLELETPRLARAQARFSVIADGPRRVLR